MYVPQEFADVVFERKCTLLEYHKREGDPNAILSAWQDDTRIITFSVPLSGVPDVVKTAIGNLPIPLLCDYNNIPKLEPGKKSRTFMHILLTQQKLLL